MGAVVYRGLADVRRNWKALVGLALLIALVGAVVLTSLAGAGRSSSSLDRFRAQTLSADGTILTEDAAGMAEIGRLPQVAAVGRIIIPFFAPLAPGEAAARHRLVTTTPGGFLTEVDRVRVMKGRMPAEDRPHEFAVNERMAATLGLVLGETVALHAFAPEQFESEEGPTSGPAGPAVSARLVGIVRSTFDVSDEVSEDRPSGYLSPAYYERYGDEVAAFDQVYRIRLRNGPDDVPAFAAAARRIFADDPRFSFAPDTAEVARVDETIQVVAIGLRLFAAAAAIAGLLALGQALSLTLARTQADAPTLEGLGMSRSQQMASALLTVAPGIVAGTVLAVLGAFLASPWMPINLARLAEPDPGLSFDGLVLGMGGVVLAVLATALALLAAWRATRHRGPQEAEASAGAGSSWIVRALTRLRLSPSAAIGAHMAFHRGRGTSEVPVRSTMVGVVAGAASLVAVLVFIASQHTLARTPPLYGWNWDASLLAPEFESGEDQAERQSDELANESAIAELAKVRVSHAVIRGSYLHVLGVTHLKGVIEPTVLGGRAARAPDEVTFGAATMKQLGLSIGDRVTAPGVTGRPVSLRVVGRVVIPFLGTDAIADEGAIMIEAGATRLATTQDSYDLLLNWREGVDPAATRRIGERVGGVVTEKPPTDVSNLARIDAIPRALGFFLGGLAVLAVGYALVATVRRRSRDFAILRAFGLRRGQVSSAIAWQASLLTGVGLVLGLPLGIAAGRWAWAVVASAMGLDNQPAVPVIALVIAVLAAVVVANVVAVVPARVAARRNPASALRTE